MTDAQKTSAQTVALWGVVLTALVFIWGHELRQAEKITTLEAWRQSVIEAEQREAERKKMEYLKAMGATKALEGKTK